MLLVYAGPQEARAQGLVAPRGEKPLHRPPSVEVAAGLRHRPPQAHAPGLDRSTPPVPRRLQRKAARNCLWILGHEETLRKRGARRRSRRPALLSSRYRMPLPARPPRVLAVIVLSHHAVTTDYERFLEWPVIALGVLLFILSLASLASLAGALCEN
ncbi:hypothetical protein E2562_037251 [Oryza meyeriana var. granulata]|uniref:Uncharacterized protein n=1 Tax=Oryza meyeriana var. granulata TaxID=110450 RepID=A0A6G1BQP9_9ORYZ|nr:hypothetical protein E2562_037251 [Oryza meyeriana var. granulata]